MITYSLPQPNTDKLPPLDDCILDKLAQSVINEPQSLRSATILSSSKSFTESWIRKSETSGLSYHKSHNCHSLLRSPSMLANHFFIIAGEFADCTSESIQKIISPRIPSPFSFFSGSLSYCDQNIDHFNSLRVNLDLMIRIHKVTDLFLREKGHYREQHISPINRIHDLTENTEMPRFKKDIILGLKQRLSVSPEVFLASAIKGIRNTNPIV